MVSGFAVPVTSGTAVSQCAEAMRIAFGRGRLRPRFSQTPRTAPGSSACIGEPWEMNSVGSGAAISLLLLHEPFGLERFLHLRSRRHAFLVVGDRRPLRQVELARTRP